jgi:hypothetical protein
MKLSSSLLLALALCLVAPSASFGQISPPAPGDRWAGPTNLPDIGGSNQTPITNRVSLQGRFVGTGIEGKIRLASGTQGTTIVQGLKASVSGVTPGSQYALVLDNRLVATGTANAAGVIKFVFLTPTNGRVPAVPESAGIVTTATTASLVAVADQRVVATAQLTAGSVKPR